MKTPPIVSAQEWDAALAQMLVKEKELTRARDALAAERRRMPWLAVDKEYRFRGSGRHREPPRPLRGRRPVDRLPRLPRARCARLAGARPASAARWGRPVAHVAHLNVRDTTLAFASRAPQADIERVKVRMGWEMPCTR